MCNFCEKNCKPQIEICEKLYDTKPTKKKKSLIACAVCYSCLDDCLGLGLHSLASFLLLVLYMFCDLMSI